MQSNAMKTHLFAATLLLASAATAQITQLGGGSSPLFFSGQPTLGSTLQISPLIAPLPAIIVGTGRQDLAVNSIGAGCNHVLVPTLDVLTPITYSLAIPNDANLVGFTFYAQGVLFGAGTCQLDFFFGLSNAVQIQIQP